MFAELFNHRGLLFFLLHRRCSEKPNLKLKELRGTQSVMSLRVWITLVAVFPDSFARAEKFFFPRIASSTCSRSGNTEQSTQKSLYFRKKKGKEPHSTTREAKRSRCPFSLGSYPIFMQTCAEHRTKLCLSARVRMQVRGVVSVQLSGDEQAVFYLSTASVQ